MPEDNSDLSRLAEAIAAGDASTARKLVSGRGPEMERVRKLVLAIRAHAAATLAEIPASWLPRAGDEHTWELRG